MQLDAAGPAAALLVGPGVLVQGAGPGVGVGVGGGGGGGGADGVAAATASSGFFSGGASFFTSADNEATSTFGLPDFSTGPTGPTATGPGGKRSAGAALAGDGGVGVGVTPLGLLRAAPDMAAQELPSAQSEDGDPSKLVDLNFLA